MARPAGWFLPVPGEAAPPAGPGTEPARADLPAEAGPRAGGPEADYSDPESRGPSEHAAESEPDGDWFPAPAYPALGQRLEPPTTIDRSGAQLAALERYAAHQRELSQRGPGTPVVGPTAALRGRAGGPGFEAGDLAADGYDAGLRSGWQLADGLWRDSGIRWARTSVRLEQTAVEREEPAVEREEPPVRREEPPVRREEAPVQWEEPSVQWEEPPVQWAPAAGPPPAQAFAAAPVMADAVPVGAVPMGGVPVGAVPVGSVPVGSVPLGSVPFDSGAQTVVDAPVPDFGPPRELAPRRRGAARQLVRVGLPVAVIVTVGAGAFMMLTGRSGEMLASSANQNPQAGKGMSAANAPTAAAANAAGNALAPGSGAQGAFGGYPGQHGAITVSSIAAAGATQIAAGSADGRPAIWRRDPSGNWALVSAREPAVYSAPGVGGLNSVVHGRAGWVAVGDVASGKPIVLMSADGGTWQAVPGGSAFRGGQVFVNDVAAGPDGYVIVGQQMSGDRKSAIMWWSSDLKTWVPVSDGDPDGGATPGDAYAVAADGAGFVAVGRHGSASAIWTTGTGQSWVPVNVPPPAGDAHAALQRLVITGTRIVAAGYAITRTGAHVPLVVTSVDHGRSWQQVILAKPGASGAITGLTASGPGFTATGTSGEGPATWTSPDGLTWTESAKTG